jgi:hypothetical protein
MNMNMTPTRKVGTGAAAGAFVTLAIWLAGMFGVDLPPEGAAGITTVLTFALSWLVPERKPTR